MAIVIAMVMVVAMGVTAFAEDGDPTGSITVKPSDSVTLTGKTLKAYKVLDATYSPATSELQGDEKQAISYTIPAALISFYDDYFAQKADATATPPIDQRRFLKRQEKWSVQTGYEKGIGADRCGQFRRLP